MFLLNGKGHASASSRGQAFGDFSYQMSLGEMGIFNANLEYSSIRLEKDLYFPRVQSGVLCNPVLIPNCCVALHLISLEY